MLLHILFLYIVFKKELANTQLDIQKHIQL